MNTMDILYGLNDVRDSYVIAAEELRQGKRQARRLPKNCLLYTSPSPRDA